MATQEEIYLLTVKIQNEQEARRLAASIALAEQKYQTFYDTLGKSAQQTHAAAEALANLRSELAGVERQAAQTERALDKIHGSGALTGADRAGAKARGGLFVANTLQDMIQGGPASGINNVLGAAQDGGIKALAGEFVAAAGGAGALAAALGTVAVVAGAAFLTINTGLSSANLGWSDLGSVVDEMAGGAFSDAGKVMSENIGDAWESVKGFVGGIADATIGWNDATSAVAAHKTEIEKVNDSYQAYIKAAKEIAGIKSDAQKEDAKVGKAFGEDVADLGGKGGLDAVLDKLAGEARDADKTVKRTVTVKDKDGKDVQQEQEVTNKQIAKEALTQDVANAVKGDAASQEALRKRLGGAGFDPTQVGQLGHKDEMKKARDAEREARNKEEEEALKDLHDLGVMRKRNFDKQVAEERKSNAYFDIPEAQRTDAQKEAAKQDKEDDEAKARDRAEKARRLDQTRNNLDNWQGQNPELDDEFQKKVREDLKKQAKDQHDLQKMRRDDQISGLDKQMDKIRDEPKRGNSSIQEDGAAFAARLQGGVKSYSDQIADNSLKELKAIKEAIQRQQQLADRKARFS